MRVYTFKQHTCTVSLIYEQDASCHNLCTFLVITVGHYDFRSFNYELQSVLRIYLHNNITD
jgi:hypothetical protein